MIAAMFSMTTILWIAKNIFGVAVTAMVVVFQPELRKALEVLGKSNFFGSFSIFGQQINSREITEDSIREIIPFPMNKNAQDVMMDAPGYVTEKQLKELHIKVTE